MELSKVMRCIDLTKRSRSLRGLGVFWRLTSDNSLLIMSIKGRGKQMRNYEPEFKQKIVRLHLEEGRTIKSLSEEYEVSKASISIWVSNCSQECLTNQQTKEEYDYMMENRKLRKQLEEMEKENRFLKKASAFFAKEID
jgi:transposase